ncbi:MAG: hypothetical protein O7B81_12575 [Gammaproteobacteria bacterium]|nr:hypothetical protein [Gammaproteobacteria bacterium]
MRVRLTNSGHARSAVLALTLLGVSANACWAEEGPFPVRVNPRLALERVDAAAIDARLRGPLWPDWPDSGGAELFKLAPLSPDGPIESFEERIVDVKVANNCIELRALSDAGYEGRYRNDWEVQRGLLRQCDVIEMLRDVGEARMSYVQDFVLTADAPDVLPPMIENGAMFRRLCDQYIANDRSIPWSTFDKIVEVEVHSPFDIHVWAEHAVLKDDVGNELPVGALTVVWLWAWGDFTGDGVEDVLVETISQAAHWSGPGRTPPWLARNSFGELYVLTRMGSDDVLKVADADKYLNPENLQFQTCLYP